MAGGGATTGAVTVYTGVDTVGAAGAAGAGGAATGAYAAGATGACAWAMFFASLKEVI